jgi:exopolysaccharide biosynthesis WecB/TagA/CpsF family protein
MDKTMTKIGVKYPYKRIFIIDELSVIAAFLVSLLIRYGMDFGKWTELFDGLYVTYFFVLCMLEIIVFLVFDSKKNSIFIQDPVEILGNVLKGKILLNVAGLFYLYLNQRGEESSRFVIVAFFGLSIIIEFMIKLVYKKLYNRKHGHLYTLKTLEIKKPFPQASVVKEQFEKGDYDEVLVHAGSADEATAQALVNSLVDSGIRTYVTICSLGYEVRSGIVYDVNRFASIPAGVRADKFNVFGVKYSIARAEEAVLHVKRRVKELSGKYICFSNVHTSVMAREDAAYRDILNGAAYVFPDGKPIATLQQKEGYIGAERVAGPDFMERMFRDTMDGSVSHYFYGSTQETLDALREQLEARYPGLVIKGMYSPVFGEVSEQQDAEDVKRINDADAGIVWIGLGAPKQEKWMNAHEGRIHGVMMGVGAGFNFHAGNIKRAPVWMQRIGLEWLFRLFQDPKRLFKRYFVTNTKFFWYLLMR